MCSKSDETRVAYIILVDKGYSKMMGFKCLDKLQEQFEAKFSSEDINKAKNYGLNKKFKNNLILAYVSIFLNFWLIFG